MGVGSQGISGWPLDRRTPQVTTFVPLKGRVYVRVLIVVDLVFSAFLVERHVEV